jgi:dolichol-phosphate mannosyltransferase
MKKVMIIIPTYNEKQNIGRLVDEIMEYEGGYRILIVDDNSNDGTGDIADQLSRTYKGRVHVIHRPGKLGLGSAYKEGFQYALQKDVDVIFQMDADFSHNPRYLPSFVNMIKDYDVVVGSRYTKGISIVNWPLRRLALSLFANWYARTITGLRLTDCTSGFKCFKRGVLETIDIGRIRSEGYAFQIEVNYSCQSKGFNIGELGIIFIERKSGASKMCAAVAREAALIVWRLRLFSLLEDIRNWSGGFIRSALRRIFAHQ